MNRLLPMMLLSPLLLWQGKRVRANTPRLPEAPGHRAGVSGRGDGLSLWILGDSAAAGVGASSQDTALSGQLTARLSQRFEVSWTLFAQTGETTPSMLQKLQKQSGCADVVLVSLGVNDVTSLMSVGAFKRQTRHLIRAIREGLKAKQIILTALPPMADFPALPQPLRWFLGLCAEELNAAMIEVCRQETCDYLRIPVPSDRALDRDYWFASDGFHPGEPLYAEWAKAAAAIIKSESLTE